MAQPLQTILTAQLRGVVFPPARWVLLVQTAGDRNAALRTPEEAWRSAALEALLDGPMFDLCPGTPSARTQAERYRLASCARLVYGVLDTAARLSIPSQLPTAGLTFARVGEQLHVARGWNVHPGANLALQCYPALVLEGRVVASNVGSNAERNERAAVARMTDGAMAFVVGRTDMIDFATRLVQLGVRDAGYTDGGGSAYVGLHASQLAGSSEHRRVPVWLGVGAPVPPFVERMFPYVTVGLSALLGGAVQHGVAVMRARARAELEATQGRVR